MKIQTFMEGIHQLGISFYTGVPDSYLKALCDFLMSEYGVGNHHIVAANEGASVALAAGHFLSTGNPALVYMQNSGIGNAVNPICSLVHKKVYDIPVLFVIGWRGEPGTKDEPQHIFQGEITQSLLNILEIQHSLISPDTSPDEFHKDIDKAQKALNQGSCYAFLIRKGSLENDFKNVYQNSLSISREQVIKEIIGQSLPDDIFVSTTGKLSRELFEIRESLQEGHSKDFLTVGSMGHSSMIALEIARNKPCKTVFCLDGDGAVLMHMGSLAIIGSHGPENYIHILINNGAHETVGGIPTVSQQMDYLGLASACGYPIVRKAEDQQQLSEILKEIRILKGPVFIEIDTNLISRPDLGRPTTSTIENKQAFMDTLKEKQ